MENKFNDKLEFSHFGLKRKTLKPFTKRSFMNLHESRDVGTKSNLLDNPKVPRPIAQRDFALCVPVSLPCPEVLVYYQLEDV